MAISKLSNPLKEAAKALWSLHSNCVQIRRHPDVRNSHLPTLLYRLFIRDSTGSSDYQEASWACSRKANGIRSGVATYNETPRNPKEVLFFTFYFWF